MHHHSSPQSALVSTRQHFITSTVFIRPFFQKFPAFPPLCVVPFGLWGVLALFSASIRHFAAFFGVSRRDVAALQSPLLRAPRLGAGALRFPPPPPLSLSFSTHSQSLSLSVPVCGGPRIVSQVPQSACTSLRVFSSRPPVFSSALDKFSCVIRLFQQTRANPFAFFRKRCIFSSFSSR